MAPAATPAPGGYIPYDAPLPGGASAAQGALLANTAYQKALAALNLKRQSTLRSYGYLGDLDAKTGALTNMRVDPFNPYGQFQSLLSQSAAASDQAVNQAESRGLRGGLAHQLVSAVQRQHGAASQALGTSLADTLADFQNQQESANETRNQALYQALLDNARAAVGNDTNPAAPPGPTPTPPGGGDGGGGSQSDPYADWLASQSAAAGMYRTNKPKGIHGVYIS